MGMRATWIFFIMKLRMSMEIISIGNRRSAGCGCVSPKIPSECKMSRILERRLGFAGSCRLRKERSVARRVLGGATSISRDRPAGASHPIALFNLLTANRNECSGGQVIAMMQAANSGYNLAAYLCSCCCHPTRRRSLFQREVGPVVMVVADVFGHETLKMPLVEHNHVIEQIPAAVADKALGDTVLPRIAEARPLGFVRAE